jgi:hypothetical protein
VSALAENVGSLGYRGVVSAEASQPFSWGPPATGQPEPDLPSEMRPAAIVDALIDQERVDFLRSYGEAMAKAAQTYDLTPVFKVLANYHRIAVATQQEGAEAHRRLLAKADLIARTGTNPDARPYEELKELLDKRLGR